MREYRPPVSNWSRWEAARIDPQYYLYWLNFSDFFVRKNTDIDTKAQLQDSFNELELGEEIENQKEGCKAKIKDKWQSY